MPSITKQLLIHSIDLVEIDGSTHIPTALAYLNSGPPLVGHFARSASPRISVNEDFKVELGMVQPASARARRQFVTATGERKSASDLTADFCHHAVTKLNDWLADRGLAQTTTILVAEPLQLQSGDAPPDWLSNYRNTIRRILLGQGFQDVEFLPEPFAVFQYYRYGIRVQPVIEHAKHIVLVIDAGGGTTDVCVIETTKEGDISQSGPNSKPLGAASTPHGGFSLNRLIAQFLLNKVHRHHASKIGTGVGQYKQWKKGQIALDTMSVEYRHFVSHFHDMVHEVEAPKVALCRSISRWSLDPGPDDSSAVPVSVPSHPFSSSTERVEARLTAGDLRRIFVDDLWKPHLRPLIKTCLSRAQSELRSQPITVCLLSGGSSNVGWFRLLVESELSSQFESPVPAIPILDYQEVVAKGLAVECTRRFFNKDGDFSQPMTYNRLCLVLNPDGAGASLKPFAPQQLDLPSTDGLPGVLLPSASILRRFIDQSMTWKVRLDKAPRHRLDYYFLRSSFDPTDVTNLQNIEENSLSTPRTASFESHVKVLLTVRADGTATPEFVYHQGRDGEGATFVRGKPFYLDMTYGSSSPARAYVGFDFGTSNSSLSYVDERRVQTYQTRVAERGWQTLNRLDLFLAIATRIIAGQVPS